MHNLTRGSMKMTTRFPILPLKFISAACTAAMLIVAATALFAQPMLGTENGEWRYLGGNIGHTRYSPLDQINRTNFGELEPAWIWRTDNFGPNPDYFSRSTPIYVDGVLDGEAVATGRIDDGGQPLGIGNQITRD